MRTAFIETLTDLARRDPRIQLIVGDLGFGVVTEFMKDMPKQFLNAGVAEQNMTGMAAGMALSGKIVFTYSIANFPVLRCLEQIRNDVCYHKANVKIVAVGGGMAYGSLGISHHATEDIAIMRALPGMTVFTPNDDVETRFVTRYAATHDGPMYLRLGRAGEPNVHADSSSLEFGKAVRLREGRDLTLMATGGLLNEALIAARKLAEHNLESRVLSFHAVKPLDDSAIASAASETNAIFTIEEHSIVGGFGSAVAESLLQGGKAPFFRRIGLQDSFSSKVGDQEYLRAEYGLDARGIVQTVLRDLGSAGGRWLCVSA